MYVEAILLPDGLRRQPSVKGEIFSALPVYEAEKFNYPMDAQCASYYHRDENIRLPFSSVFGRQTMPEWERERESLRSLRAGQREPETTRLSVKKKQYTSR